MQGIRDGGTHRPGIESRPKTSQNKCVFGQTTGRAAPTRNRQLGHPKPTLEVTQSGQESEPGREPGHAARRELQSPQIPHPMARGKCLIRLILCLDTIFYTTDGWLSRGTVVAHRSGILYLRTVHKLNTTAGL